MELLGKGKTAEVFLLDEYKVMKLFFPNFYQPAIHFEYNAMKCINNVYTNAPKCYDFIQYENRDAIVYERIYGRSLLNLLVSNPFKTILYSKKMAHEHYKLHQHKTNNLIDQKKKFADQLSIVKNVFHYNYDYLIQKLSKMGNENSLCHGDFHPDNILINDKNCFLIDWMNCYSGSPASDIARTCISILTPFIPDSIPLYLHSFIRFLKKLTLKSYINEYIRISSIQKSDIENWIDIIAAARLLDEIPGEKEWLYNLIKNKGKNLFK